jgi:hypothetical protein
MALSAVSASATTCGVEPGEELMGEDGLLRIRGRVFTDIVRSSDPRLTGSNRVTVSLDLDPSAGTGQLTASFILTPEESEGAWEGEMLGSLNGMIAATGLARGTGALSGAVAYLNFQQVASHPSGEPGCDEALAFYAMTGLIRDPS